MAGIEAAQDSRALERRRDEESQLIRFEALFSMIERLTLSATLEESARSLSQLRHIAQVTAWRLILRRQEGFVCIDGVNGTVVVVEQLEQPEWDAALWDIHRPKVVSPERSGASDAPAHLTGSHMGQLYAMPMRREGQPPCVIVVGTRKSEFSAVDLKFLRMATGVICDHMAAIVMRNHLIQALQEQAWRDGLTGLANRVAVTDHLNRSMAASRRTNTPLSVLLADIDHFKLINDTYGHAAGDEVLREVARRMAGLTREGDLVGRYGGEEFLGVLHGCDDEGAMIVAERLRSGICQNPFTITSIEPSHEITVTLSIGTASMRTFPDRRAMELVHLADEALYEAKNSGRNRVCTAADKDLTSFDTGIPFAITIPPHESAPLHTPQGEA